MDSRTTLEVQEYMKRLNKKGLTFVPMMYFAEITSELSQIGVKYDFEIDANAGMAKIEVGEWKNEELAR